MLCCGAVDKEGQERDRELNKYLQDSNKSEKRKIKLLLLGAGESGKSTVFKQMRILYGKPPSTDERENYTSVVYNNIVTSMKQILQQASEWELYTQIGDQSSAQLVDNLPDSAPVDETVGAAVKALWADAVIQQVWGRRNEFQVVDSMKFFFTEIDRIMKADYLATADDFLFTRVRTSGVVTTSYIIEGAEFEMYDVGGQRNERRKWIHCFSDVTAVIFVAALSEYDQVLFEDSSTNRVKEALNLFEEICALKYFASSSIMLFLNKHDLFEEKIATRPIQNVECWSDYQGSSLEEAEKYFLDMFLERNANEDRNVFYHFTTATSTSNIKFVFEACKSIILEQNIKDSGF
jgi:GTPase SAR1 family protein